MWQLSRKHRSEGTGALDSPNLPPGLQDLSVLLGVEVSAELPAGRRRHGNSQSDTGIPKAGQQERKDELPQIWPSPLLALPWGPGSLAGQRGRAGWTAGTNGKRKGPFKDDRGTQAHKQKT